MRSCVDGSHAAAVLKDGDLILAVNEQPVTSYRHVESIIAAQLNAARCNDSDLSANSKVQLAAGCSFGPKEDSLCAAASDGHVQSPAGRVKAHSNPTYSAAAMQDNTTGAGVNNSPTAVSAALIKAGRLQTDAPVASPTSSQQDGIAKPAVAVIIFRGAAVQTVSVQLGLEDGYGTRRIVHWCGAMLQVAKQCIISCTCCVLMCDMSTTMT